MSDRYDLAIRGGDVVDPDARRRADVYVRDGRIAEVGTERREAAEAVDAAGLLVMPGMVDAHVHFMDPGDPEREDFPPASAAAARAGVTTVVEHTHVAPVIAARRPRGKARATSPIARASTSRWPRTPGPTASTRSGRCGARAPASSRRSPARRTGCLGFSAADLHALLQRVAACGAVCLVHAEEETLLDRAERELRAAGRADPGVVPEWRNRAAELTALAVTATLARRDRARAWSPPT